MPSKPRGGREGRNHEFLPPELRYRQHLQPRGIASRMLGPSEPVVPDIETMIDQPTSTLDEATLISGYRNAHGALERPETAVIDESGLVYGEPVTRGRTPDKEV